MNSGGTPVGEGEALDVARILAMTETGEVARRYSPPEVYEIAIGLNAHMTGAPFDVDSWFPGDGTGAPDYLAPLVADPTTLEGVGDLDAGWHFSPRPFPFEVPTGAVDPFDWDALGDEDWRPEAAAAVEEANEIIGARRRRWADLTAYESVLARELGEEGRTWDRALDMLSGLFWGTWGAIVVTEGWTAEAAGLQMLTGRDAGTEALREFLESGVSGESVIARSVDLTGGLLWIWDSATAAIHSGEAWSDAPLGRLVRLYGLPERFSVTQAGAAAAVVHEAGLAAARGRGYWLRLAAARFVQSSLIRAGADEPTAERFSDWVAERNKGGAPRDVTKLRRRLLALRDIFEVNHDGALEPIRFGRIEKLADLERALEAVLDEAGDTDAEGRSVIRQIRRFCRTRGVRLPGSEIGDWSALARQITPSGTLQSGPDTTGPDTN